MDGADQQRTGALLERALAATARGGDDGDDGAASGAWEKLKLTPDKAVALLRRPPVRACAPHRRRPRRSRRLFFFHVIFSVSPERRLFVFFLILAERRS